jgi:hypothetical protein
MTYTDVGNAGFAGAKTCPCQRGIQHILYIKKAACSQRRLFMV